MDISSLLLFTKQSGASDLHVSSGAPPMVRVNGAMRAVSIPGVPEGPMADPIVHQMIYGVLSDSHRSRLERDQELDFAISLGEKGRFRANVFFQGRGIGAVFRVIPTTIPSFEDLALPDTFRTFTTLERGLVLVTGPTGSGKSTTLAAMIDLINEESQRHIITIEDPIEFVHPPKRSLVNQREVGRHTHSFANALRSALREDPDVILLGEMRDLETISLAITAAETGHLVFGTLHTNNAAKTVDRIINVFPAGEQAQIRAMLAESLQAVISQVLLPKFDGQGRIAAHEILISTSAVQAMIREGKTHQIPSAIQTGRKAGMRSMEQAITKLRTLGVVARDAGVKWEATAGLPGEEVQSSDARTARTRLLKERVRG
ncbi:MAG: type IV pilus twitching motility protein PilT [Planctomycetota bacterium]|nr:type IV pilus twitching motility protein PilT [Planctomycetota bacterium]